MLTAASLSAPGRQINNESSTAPWPCGSLLLLGIHRLWPRRLQRSAGLEKSQIIADLDALFQGTLRYLKHFGLHHSHLPFVSSSFLPSQADCKSLPRCLLANQRHRRRGNPALTWLYSPTNICSCPLLEVTYRGKQLFDLISCNRYCYTIVIGVLWSSINFHSFLLVFFF